MELILRNGFKIAFGVKFLAEIGVNSCGMELTSLKSKP
jgi:hypothetical protein